MIEFARACDDIASTPAKLAKIDRLATYFRTLAPADLRAAARFVTGNPLAARDDRRLAIGYRTLLAAARKVWAFDEAAFSAGYRAKGDLGEAIASVFGAAAAPGLFAETLGPAMFAALLDGLASAEGKAVARRREALCERVFRACATPREAAYVAKILTGDLRIGLREGLVLEAIAAASACDAATVRRAATAAGDIGEVAVAARAKTLDEIAVRYFAPIAAMLATPVAFGSSYRELAEGTWLVEDKFDGMRAQAHVRGGEARLFSRTLNDISRAFPEIIAVLRAFPGDAIFDGEIVAQRDGTVLPFRYLQPRLQRVDPSPELIAEIPVRYVAFDVLALGDRFLLDEPLLERRSAGASLMLPGETFAPAPWQTLEPGATPAAIESLFEASRGRGNEGLVLKRADGPYIPGRRGKWWVKLKRELATLDVVVLAVEWGHGKRNRVLSDYTFAVRRSAGDGELLPIGKAYSGLTDAEIAEMTTWFLAHTSSPPSGRRLAVEPQIVIEVAFDIIQKSSLHASGFALRFPRIARLRPDKEPSQIDTLADVERIYREMLQREGVHE